MTGASTGPVVGRAYEVRRDPTGNLAVARTTVQLDGARIDGDALVGAQVIVRSRAVIVSLAADGELVGVPVPPWPATGMDLDFDPADGGVRTRVNRRSGGQYNAQIVAATRFGMVNAFHHLSRAADRVNGLLADLGAPILPPVVVMVGAHSGSNVRGFAQGDGDFRTGRMRPLSGGHYRLSTSTTGVPEPFPVASTGEIHLGPGRVRQPFAGQPSYLLGAAHNPATIYHEFGHHICRHTADFRLNAERPAERQRNGKPGLEEGICDYLAASFLGTGRPYGWYRPHRGQRRDPGQAWTTKAHRGFPPSSDPHDLGRPWAAGFWQARERLLGLGLLRDPDVYDRALLSALLEIGTVGSRPRDRRSRKARQLERSSAAAVIGAFGRAINDTAGTQAAALAEESLRIHVVGTINHRVVEE